MRSYVNWPYKHDYVASIFTKQQACERKMEHGLVMLAYQYQLINSF